MIVDACTRVWEGAEAWAIEGGLRPASSKELMSAEEGLGVSFVVGYRADRMGARVPVERVAAWVKEAPGARVGFAGIDPLSGTVIADLERAAELGLAGVTVAPADAGCRPTHEACRLMLEWCASRGIPVLVSNPGLGRPASVLEYADPALFDEALREIRGLRVVFEDLGRAYTESALAMIAKHAGAFATMSALVGKPGGLYQTLLAAYERGVMAKALFGSGFPEHAPQEAIERVYSVNGLPSGGGGAWPAIPREQLRRMIERDTVGLLGLDSAAAAAEREATAKPERQSRSLRRFEIGQSA